MKTVNNEVMRRFGLVGKNIGYSFSRSYFREKFQKLGIDAIYENFDLSDVYELNRVLESNPSLEGLNVTIPYKEKILPLLDEIDRTAAEIGAVNTVKMLKNGKLKGFNTDYYGFVESIKPLLRDHHEKALILGTGGASKAVAYGFKFLEIPHQYVSRKASEISFSYKELTKEILQEYKVIVNCTPLGTSPKTNEVPAVPTEFITENHLVFDLIYNPAETRLMKLASDNGAVVTNGLKMLELQAEKAWEIWNSPES